PHPNPLPKGEGAIPYREDSVIHRESGTTFAHQFFKVIVAGSVFSLAFILVLAPWTIRNLRVFHLFQPLAPVHGEMPGEFVPRGYQRWLRTWIDDDKYIAPMLWSLDSERILIKDLPSTAFDSPEEKDRVVALLQKYNYPDGQPNQIAT